MLCCLRNLSWSLFRFLPPVMMSNHGNERVVCKQKQLTEISRSQITPRLRPQIPHELKRRRGVEKVRAVELQYLSTTDGQIISSAISKLQTQQPNTFLASLMISTMPLSATFPTFQQFVNCSTQLLCTTCSGQGRSELGLPLLNL